MLENLIFDRTISAIDMKKLLKVFAIVIRSCMYFSSFLIVDGVIVFMFHCHLRFNSYPSVINTFINVFIKKLSEIFSFCSFEECGKEISVGLVITVIKFLTLNLTLI